MRSDVAELMLGLKADTPDMTPDGDRKDGTGLQVYRHTFAQIAFPGGVTAYNVPALIQSNSMMPQSGQNSDAGQPRAIHSRSAPAHSEASPLGMDVLHQLHLTIVQAQQKLYVTSAS